MITASLENKLRNKVEQTKNGHTIVGPQNSSISPLQRAQDHLFLLGSVYGNGHPASAATPEMIMQSQQSGDMLTWLLYEEDLAVGMANMEILPNGIGELCRTCRLPLGAELQNGHPLMREVKNTAAMYQRLLDMLTDPQLSKKLSIIQADLRLADDIPLSNGEILTAGVKTQHINLEAGLKPWLLCVPRYQVHIEDKEPHQEVFLQSRLYLQPENITPEPLYLSTDSNLGVTNSNIAKATYEYAYNVSPTIIDSVAQAEESPHLSLERTAGIHYSTINASGEIQIETLSSAIKEGLDQSRFVEMIIENNPGNITTQKVAEKAGLIPLGVQPGGVFDVNDRKVSVPTTIHYGIARAESIKQMVPIRVAQELKNTPIEILTNGLYGIWKQHELYKLINN